MIRIISSQKICLIGKAKDVFQEFDKISKKNCTLEEVINGYRDKLQLLSPQLQEK